MSHTFHTFLLQSDTLGKSFISTMNENISRNLYTAFLHDLYAQVWGGVGEFEHRSHHLYN